MEDQRRPVHSTLILIPDVITPPGVTLQEFLDISKAKRPGQDQKRVNVDFPVWMIHSLDKEAKRLGVPRQSIIKIWIAERLKEVSK